MLSTRRRYKWAASPNIMIIVVHQCPNWRTLVYLLYKERGLSALMISRVSSVAAALVLSTAHWESTDNLASCLWRKVMLWGMSTGARWCFHVLLMYMSVVYSVSLYFPSVQCGVVGGGCWVLVSPWHDMVTCSTLVLLINPSPSREV